MVTGDYQVGGANEVIRVNSSQNPLNFSYMEYSGFKGLQALLFFGIPIVWCVWQLIVLKRDAKSEQNKPE